MASKAREIDSAKAGRPPKPLNNSISHVKVRGDLNTLQTAATPRVIAGVVSAFVSWFWVSCFTDI
jgi:hypothetical protein